VNRQNNCTDVDPSLIGGGRRRFQDDKHVPQPPAGFPGVCGIAISVNSLHAPSSRLYPSNDILR
jgi:hypothetical protein